MTSTKVNLGLGVLVAAGLIAPWFIVHRANRDLLAANRVLTLRLQDLGADNARLSNALAQATDAHRLAGRRQEELMRLRGEVSLLRRQVLGPTAARSAPPSRPDDPGSPPPSGAGSTPQVLPRELWNFAGYATPEAALESIAWAASQGDLQTFLGSLTEAGRAQFEKETEGKSQSEVQSLLTSLLGETQAIRLDQKRVSDDGQVSFVLSYREQNDGAQTTRDEQLITLVQVDGQWKMAE